MVIIVTSICVIVPVLAQQSEFDDTPQQAVRFAPLHIYLDSGNQPLAAYQFELKAMAGQIKIVGVEAGEHPAFKQPPYYDPAALMNNRIIIADFKPRGRIEILPSIPQLTAYGILLKAQLGKTLGGNFLNKFKITCLGFNKKVGYYFNPFELKKYVIPFLEYEKKH